MLTTESLNNEKVDIRLYSPQALAFLGDAVYEILVRERIVHRANMPVNNWQRSDADEISARLSRRKTERCRIIAAQPVWSVCLDICI